MVFFAFSAIYLMPLLGIAFVLVLLRAIEKIVRKQKCVGEKLWASALFAWIVWSIGVVTASGN